jgi:ABC-2 type transport system permease protein
VTAYVALMRANLNSTMRYRLSYLFGTFGMIFQLVALLAVWRVLLADGPLGGFTWPQMQAYLLVAFTCGVIVSQFADWRMAFRIESGMVSLDLVKPIDYQWARFAEVLGSLAIEVSFVVLGWLAVIAFGGGVALPPPGLLVIFLASLVLVVPLKFLVVYLSGLACFYTHHYNGVAWARIAVVSLLSGSLIPLAFFPGWLATAAAWLPFAGMASTPGLIFVGAVDQTEALRLVAVQVGWTVLMWWGVRQAFAAAVRRLTVHGG